MTTTDLYVSTTGSDSNAGTQTSPFKTILAASLAAQPGPRRAPSITSRTRLVALRSFPA